MNATFDLPSMTATVIADYTPEVYQKLENSFKTDSWPYSVVTNELGFDDEVNEMYIELDCSTWKDNSDESAEEYLLEEIEVVKELIQERI